MPPKATVITTEFFNTVSPKVSKHIKAKLAVMEIDVVDVELHNSSMTKTFRAYISVKRTANIKALYLAEKIISEEIEELFAFRPYAFYWRYCPEFPGQ
jgi:ribosome maturation factor RimP